MIYNTGQMKEEASPKVKGSRVNQDDGPRGFASPRESVTKDRGSVKQILSRELDSAGRKLTQARQELSQRVQESAAEARQEVAREEKTGYNGTTQNNTEVQQLSQERKYRRPKLSQSEWSLLNRKEGGRPQDEDPRAKGKARNHSGCGLSDFW